MLYDLLTKNGRIVDDVGRPAFTDSHVAPEPFSVWPTVSLGVTDDGFNGVVVNESGFATSLLSGVAEIALFPITAVVLSSRIVLIGAGVTIITAGGVAIGWAAIFLLLSGMRDLQVATAGSGVDIRV